MSLLLLRRFIFISVFRRMVNVSSSRPSSDIAAFQLALSKARHVAVITGAGVSAESGVPTFRGHGGFWRRYQAQDLATPEAFQRDPSLVWEFYHYRRDLVLSKKPNAAHYAISNLEAKFSTIGRQITVITQNIDELHTVAGTKNSIELHGSLFKTMCTDCKDVRQNHQNPICPALAGKGAPDPDADEIIDPKLLPRCTICAGLLRPYVVWFGENLDAKVLKSAQEVTRRCDFCIVVGTSAVVYPAALLAPEAAARGVPVAEFNIDKTPAINEFDFYFEGPAGITLPKALDVIPV